jgi:hypothetical protein
MRAILINVMLIITAIMIYNSTVGGDYGAKERVKERGGSVNQTIERINP